MRIHRLLSVWEGERIKSQREAKKEKREQVKGVCPGTVKCQDVDDLACPVSKPTLETVFNRVLRNALDSKETC